MAYSIKIKEEYWQNLTEAFEYYSSVNVKLGLRFYGETDATLVKIMESPLSYQLISYQLKNKNYRQVLVKNFPFQVIYEIIENDIIVYTLFPAKSNPAKKPK